MSEQAETLQQERLAALYALSAQLGMTLDLPLLLNQVMDALVQLTSAERAFVVLVDPLGGGLETVVARSVDQETIGDALPQFSHTIVEHVIKKGEPVLTGDAQEDERFATGESVGSLSLRSIMCAPLRARGKVVGAVIVDNRLKVGAFTREDLQLLIAFGTQAAIAIENARLFQQTDEALARRVDELTLFQRIDLQLNRSLDLGEVLDLALEWAIALTGADGGSIGLLQPGGAGQDCPSLQLYALRGSALPGPEYSLPVTHPVLSAVAEHGGSVLTHDVTVSSAIDGSPAATQLAVAIRSDGAPLGLITLESQHDHAFTEEDILFAERLADRAAVAIAKARLYEQVLQANRAKSEFISLVTHELRIPMTSIRGYADLLLAELAGPLSDSQKQFLKTIRRNLDRMAVLVGDLADINRMESGRMTFELGEFDLNQLVEEVARDLADALDARQQTLTLALAPLLPAAYADRTRIVQVLENLLDNAHKYTPEGGAITVWTQRVGDRLEVAVSDNGIGISPEDQARLFTQFFRSDHDAVRAQNGWGLGLSIARKLVEAQGGQIEFNSVLGEGSTFSFTVPLVEGASDDR
ncbi:MAG: GAF domain-containing sensor histidine kinase [Chloroflexi bacterium]|jgi:signal transduction histidine kinase|nr:GAF domain-containing sensor histidine kinase [Chloroflexota bacterium]